MVLFLLIIHTNYMAVYQITSVIENLFIRYSIISVFGSSKAFSSSSIKIAQKSHQSKSAAKTTATTLIHVFCFIRFLF